MHQDGLGNSEFIEPKMVGVYGNWNYQCVRFLDPGERGLLGAFDIVSQECNGFHKIQGLPDMLLHLHRQMTHPPLDFKIGDKFFIQSDNICTT